MRVDSGGWDIFACSGGDYEDEWGLPNPICSLHATQMQKGQNSRKSLDDNDVMRIISTSSFGW